MLKKKSTEAIICFILFSHPIFRSFLWQLYDDLTIVPMAAI